MTTERNFLKKQLNAFYQSEATGAQIRSKVKFVEEGERSIQYFFAVEKHRQDNNCIKALKEKGITYSDDNDLLHVASTFYSELYTSEKPTVDDINTFLDTVNLPVLTQEKQNISEGIISKQECEEALKIIKSNKSPGDDDLPIEIYRTFWSDIGS